MSHYSPSGSMKNNCSRTILVSWGKMNNQTKTTHTNNNRYQVSMYKNKSLH